MGIPFWLSSNKVWVWWGHLHLTGTGRGLLCINCIAARSTFSLSCDWKWSDVKGVSKAAQKQRSEEPAEGSRSNQRVTKAGGKAQKSLGQYQSQLTKDETGSWVGWLLFVPNKTYRQSGVAWPYSIVHVLQEVNWRLLVSYRVDQEKDGWERVTAYLRADSQENPSHEDDRRRNASRAGRQGILFW